MMTKLPALPYKHNSLEPYIDEQTMKVHHDKHHQVYTDKFNETLADYSELQKIPAEELLKDLGKIPEKIRQKVIDFGGGYVNHSFFWPLLKIGVEPKDEVLEAIKTKFGTFEKFKDEFSKQAASLFGSGWAWLVMDKGQLEIVQTSNQNTPISDGKTPLLTIDLWEHAYYLKYQNRRAEWIDAFFKILNWDQVNKNFLDALTKSR